MDPATIRLGFDAIAFARSALDGLVDKKAGQKASQAITEAMDKLGQAQDVMFQLREALATYQEENISLRESIRSMEDWEKRISTYELQSTPGGAVVYRSSQGVEHFACPSCTENREIQILQDRRVYSGEYQCPKCQACYTIKSSPPPKPGLTSTWT
jgi:predicted RNA-binding Zn-ribbon protein involved in translation (DUF1610 family)